MRRLCPNSICAARENIIRDGFYRRKDDSKFIQRYRCRNCGHRFSSATFSELYKQKKRRINRPLLELLSSGLSLRRSARLLGVNRRTIEKRMPFIAKQCRRKNDISSQKFKGRIFNVVVDDLITKENSKLKPLSVSIAVDEDRRRLLGVEVSAIPAFGHLSQIAVKKYGKRKSEHFEGLTRLFQRLGPVVSSEAIFKTDEHQLYPGFMSAYFSKSKALHI